MANINISRHTFVCHYPWNFLAKYHENPSVLHSLCIQSSTQYSAINFLNESCQNLSMVIPVIQKHMLHNSHTSTPLSF